MKDYYALREVRVAKSIQETNKLLSEYWVLLEIFASQEGPVFVLGREFDYGVPES